MGHFTKIVQTGSSKSAGFRHTKHKSNYRCARPTKVCPLQYTVELSIQKQRLLAPCPSHEGVPVAFTVPAEPH